MQEFFFSAVIFLTAAVFAVPIAARLGLGSVLGYLAAGIVIGPLTGLIGEETTEIQHFAEFGVVMMLFLIGLELTPQTLWDMRHRLIGLGGLQIGLTAIAVTIILVLLQFSLNTAIAIGLIVSLSSTAIVLQTLHEKNLMRTGGGRSAFAVLLTQDVAVIPMLAFMPLLAVSSVGFNPDGSISRGGDQGHDTHGAAISLVEGLAGWQVALVTIGVVAAIILTGVYLTRPVFRYIHAARLPEMFTAIALLIVIAIAALMSLVGLSAALGTFLAGVVLANSEFRHELESDLEPFKGLLLGLFFITVGAGMNFNVLAQAPMTILGLTLGLILIKAAVLFTISVIFKIRGRNRWLFTLSLAQAGEFGFVLVAFSKQQHVLSSGLAQQLLLIIALSMLITPILFIIANRLGRKIGDGTVSEQDTIDDQGPVIIAGVGRFGQTVNRLVRSSGIETVLLDNDLSIIQAMRSFGFRAFLGDPTRMDLLKAAGLRDARVLVVSVDDQQAALKLVKNARAERPDLHIIARAHDRNHAFALFQAGADDIVRELFDSALRAGRYVLENAGLTEFEAADAAHAFYQHDRYAVRELAEVWSPDIPPLQNEAYIKRTRELDAELQSTLMTILTSKDTDHAE